MAQPTRRADGTRKRKTVNKIVGQAHAIFQHAVEHFGLVLNVVTNIKRLRESGEVARFDFFSPEEIDLLVATAIKGSHRDPRRPAVSETERALRAEEDQQDAAIYLTAALTDYAAANCWRCFGRTSTSSSPRSASTRATAPNRPASRSPASRAPCRWSTRSLDALKELKQRPPRPPEATTCS